MDGKPPLAERQRSQKIPENNSDRCNDSDIPPLAGLLLCVSLRWGKLYSVCDSSVPSVVTGDGNRSNRLVGLV